MTSCSWFWNAIWEFIPEIKDFKYRESGRSLPDNVKSQLPDFLSILTAIEHPVIAEPAGLAQDRFASGRVRSRKATAVTVP
jgi:hypothetical protein